MRPSPFPGAVLLFSLSAAISIGARTDARDVIPHRQDKLPNRPYSPEEAVRRMSVPEGFSVELVASEPDIVNPIAMTFDERGRIWVTESLEYPRKRAGKGRDRVKVLEDADRDGRAERVTVFAEGLNIPSGVAVGHGGVWVVNAPDLLLLKEKESGEIHREVVVTGFGRTDTHELPNSLTWGPDGWLYGLNGVFNRSRVVSGGREFEFTCALWRVHPKTREFQLFCEGTSNPWGLVWDANGSAIISACHWANDHIFHFVETGYYQRQAGPYPPFTLPIGSVSDHSHQKTAYCGLAWFDSDAYPEKYRGKLYMGNCHGGSINVDSLRRDGSSYISTGEPDFLTANDVWFMPVSQRVGPDGCLYVLDWYDRYHCYQDANRDPEGVDRERGRLYRVRYRDSPRAPRFDLGAESDEDLVRRLGEPNVFFRETAQRVLTERLLASERPATRKRLARKVLDDSGRRKARLHALWTLIGSGPLEESFHARLLDHADASFRAWGVRAAGNMGIVGRGIRERIAGMSEDPSADVGLQVAIASRKVAGLDPLAVLVDVLRSCAHDKLIPAIVWPNLHPLLETEGERFVRLLSRGDRTLSPALALIAPRCVDRMLRGNAALEPVRALIESLASRDPEVAKECLWTLSLLAGDIPDERRGELRRVLGPPLETFLAGEKRSPLYLATQLLAVRLELRSADPRFIRDQFLSEEREPETRLRALEALIASRDRSLLDAVGRVLSSAPVDFLVRVLGALGRCDDPELAGVILDRYPEMDPELQPLAVDLLMQRPRWTRRLLESARKKELPPGTLNAYHLRRVLESNDREAIWLVERTWGRVRKERNPARERVTRDMEKALRETVGDPAAGERVFQRLCSRCHRLHGRGQDVGPDLTTNGRASFEQLVSNVFDPSLVIGSGYEVTTVVTVEGRTLSGIVSEESPRGIVLRLPGGKKETVAGNRIKYVHRSTLSMMPEGIEELVGERELADLFAFLSWDLHPADPRARPIPGAPPLRRAEGEARDPGKSGGR